MLYGLQTIGRLGARTPGLSFRADHPYSIEGAVTICAEHPYSIHCCSVLDSHETQSHQN